MALEPRGEIGTEVHKVDPFFRVEEGTGQAVLVDVVRRSVRMASLVIIGGDAAGMTAFRIAA
jgi:hypothetical protein